MSKYIERMFEYFSKVETKKKEIKILKIHKQFKYKHIL